MLNSSIEKISEGLINSNQTFGFKFKGKSGQKLQIELTEGVCIWIFDPNIDLYEESILIKDGIYLAQIAAPPDKSKNYVLSMGLENSSDSSQVEQYPNLIGNWEGNYALNSSEKSLLTITKQYDKYFEGTLETYGNKHNQFKLAIKGNVEFSSQKINFNETNIIFTSGGTWYLGSNKGSLSKDLHEMFGDGHDNKGNKYTWQFKKVR